MARKIVSLIKTYISDIVYGATDGLITTFVIVASASGANIPKLAVVIGLSSLVGDAVSMGASRFLSLRAEMDVKHAKRSFIKPMTHAAITFLSFIILGAIPLVAFLIPIHIWSNFAISCLFSGIALFALGSIRSFVAKTSVLAAGIETTLVGLAAGIIGYYIGSLFSG